MYVQTNHEAASRLEEHGGRLIHRYPGFSLLEIDNLTPELPASAVQAPDAAIHVNGLPVAIEEGVFSLEASPRKLIRFAGPIAAEWIQRLRALGIRVFFWCPPHGACVELPAEMAVTALPRLIPAIVGAQPYRQEQCTRRLPGRGGPSSAGGAARNWVDLVCFTQEGRDRIARELGGRVVLTHSSYKIRLAHDGPIAGLRRLAGVKIADPARVPVLATQELLAAVGYPLEVALPIHATLDGSDQVIAVADTGLDRGSTHDDLHPDFRGRVRALTSWPANPSWNAYVRDPQHDDGPADLGSGHGTHVAGLVLGSGQASGGRYRGIAPGAQLVFQAIEQYVRVRPEHESEISSDYYLSGRPLDLRELLREARELGARIHVNAWGDPARGQYTDDCYEADAFLHENQDAVILAAAGNDGADRDGNRRIDDGSLYAPACAKNVIAIGATEGPRRGVGFRGTWGDYDPEGRRFRAAGDRSDLVSGEPDRVAPLSSAGPASGGRIKPDLCAPGTNLAAPRSRATTARGWGLASPLPYYMYNSGTSMATGVAGGCVALLRQAWQRELGGIAPSGQALKALSILATRPVLRRGSDTEPESPLAAGFGRLDVGRGLPGQERPVHLVDRRESGFVTGETFDLPFVLHRAADFSAVLTWYDAPGEVLINDLDLSLIGPDGAVTWGNHPAGEAGAPDRRNTVERIARPGLSPGAYLLRVTAANVPVPPQTFALALSLPGQIEEPQVERGLRLDWVQDLSPTDAGLLAYDGVVDLQQLLALPEEDLARTISLAGRELQHLLARLLVLDGLLGRPLPLGSPPDLTLDRLTEPTPPSDTDRDTWLRLRHDLLPLIHVFEWSALRRIRLSDLFSWQT